MTSATTRRSQPRLPPGGALVGLAARARRLHSTHEEVTAAHSRRLSRCAIRSRSRKPTARSSSSSAMRAAAFPPPQRADVIGLAQAWLREGTGAIALDVPAGTPQRAAGRGYDARNPGAAVGGRRAAARHHRPPLPAGRPAPRCATIRLNYPKIAAVAGPCGLWPEDLGPSIKNKSYFENKPYYNFGCAYQRNMAAMVDNPSDLVQPRPETPSYTRAAHHGLREVSQGTHDSDHLSRGRQGQTQRHRQMISYARQNAEEQSEARRRRSTIISRRRRACRCRLSARPWKPRPPCSRPAKTAGSARPI